MLNIDCRYPIEGAAVQWRGGISRHDAVVWAFARAAGALGVDIVQGCEVTGFTIEGGRVTGVETTQGPVAAPRVCIAVAGHSSVLARKAGVALPIHSTCLQAMVTEPVKPLIDTRPDVGRDSCLREPDGPRRSRDRRRRGRLQFLRAARRPAGASRRMRRRRSNCSPA